PALEAHRRAQGGGSGIDVVASALGGTQRFQLVAGESVTAPFSLPEGLVIEVWASARSASTAEMLRRVAAFRERSPDEHRRIFEALREAAEHAAAATSADAFVDAPRRQGELSARPGRAASAPIVTFEPATRECRARREGSVARPSGAGGGDVGLLVGADRSSDELGSLGEREG